MPTASIPPLYCPFLPHISDYVEAVETHTDEWVQAFHLHDSDFDTYHASKFGHMTCRFYPTANFKRLTVTNDLLVLLFLMDDLFDHQTTTTSTITLKGLMKHCMEVLTDDRRFSLSSGGNILAALTDVWGRAKSLSSAAFQKEFVQDIALLFESIAWQKNNAAAWSTPSLEDYIRWRPLIGGAHIAGRLILFAENIHLTSKVQLHPTVQRLNMLCGHLGCWANDLFSLSKEVGHGDLHNLVLVIQHEKGISLEAAIRETAAIHDQEMAEFYTLYKSLYNFSGGAGQLVRRYAYDLAMIVRGNIDWSTQDTHRYGAGVAFAPRYL